MKYVPKYTSDLLERVVFEKYVYKTNSLFQKTFIIILVSLIQ